MHVLTFPPGNTTSWPAVGLFSFQLVPFSEDMSSSVMHVVAAVVSSHPLRSVVKLDVMMVTSSSHSCSRTWFTSNRAFCWFASLAYFCMVGIGSGLLCIFSLHLTLRSFAAPTCHACCGPGLMGNAVLPILFILIPVCPTFQYSSQLYLSTSSL